LRPMAAKGSFQGGRLRPPLYIPGDQSQRPREKWDKRLIC
jgi:hypothetical protein